MLKQKINLRMANQDADPIINLVQNDTGREIECNILDFDIPVGATSKLWMIKPSGKIASCDGTISGNMVTVALTDQVVAEDGMCVAQLKITKDGKTLSSFTMHFNFEEDASTNGIISQEEIKLVETFITEQKKKLDAYIAEKTKDIDELKTDVGNLDTSKADKAETAELKEDLGDLATFGEFYWEDGTNRLNPDLSTFTNGYLVPNDGTITGESSGYKTSDYIDVSDSVGRKVVFSYYSAIANAIYQNSCRYCFYDVNKNYISGSVSGTSATIPNNAHYVRLSFDSNQMNYMARRMVIVQDDTSIPSVLVEYTGMVKDKTYINDDVIPNTVVRQKEIINITVGIGKDFITIADGVQSITPSENKVFNILIDDGIYEEYGIILPNNVNLIGASGNREKCIIKGELPDSASASEIENNSTINLLYSNRLENLTITAKNLRYPIHSESGGNVTDWTQILNNCYVEHLGNTSPNNTWQAYHAWGEGASSGAYAEFNNCVFKGTVEPWYVHEPVNIPDNPKPYHHVLNNCDIINTSVSTTPYWIISAKIDNTTGKGVISTVDFNGCNFGNGCVSVRGDYDINVNIHGHNNVAIVRGKTSNYPSTDYTTVKTYVGTDTLTKNTVLMYADGINLVKKANASTPKHMIAGVATENCEPNGLVKVIKGTYVSKTGTVGAKVYCDDNGQFADSGTVEIGVCYGQFSLIY